MPETRVGPAHWGPYLLQGADPSALPPTEQTALIAWREALAPLTFRADLGADGEGEFGLGDGNVYRGPLHRYEMAAA